MSASKKILRTPTKKEKPKVYIWKPKVVEWIRTEHKSTTLLNELAILMKKDFPTEKHWNDHIDDIYDSMFETLDVYDKLIWKECNGFKGSRDQSPEQKDKMRLKKNIQTKLGKWVKKLFEKMNYPVKTPVKTPVKSPVKSPVKIEDEDEEEIREKQQIQKTKDDLHQIYLQIDEYLREFTLQYPDYPLAEIEIINPFRIPEQLLRNDDVYDLSPLDDALDDLSDLDFENSTI